MDIITSIFVGIAFCLGIFYLGTMLFAFVGFLRNKRGENRDYKPFVSILIAAKNEEECIAVTLEGVLGQDYPRDLYEVVLIDDASTDKTNEIAQSYAEKYPNLKIIVQNEECPYISRKKFALETGIAQAKGDILLFTDADSIVKPAWVSSMVSCYDKDERVGAVVGFVSLPKPEKFSVAMRIQELDYIGLSSFAEGFLGMGISANPNGNNLSYRKKLFYEVGGFKDVAHSRSGDDDLLLDKVAHYTDKKIRFNNDPASFVETAPVTNIASFLNQRSRWSSKTAIYKRKFISVLLVSIFIYSNFLILGALSLIYNPAAWPYYLMALGMKLVGDGFILFPALKREKRLGMFKYLIPTELFQIPWMVYAGFKGTIFGDFTWKNQASTGPLSRK